MPVRSVNHPLAPLNRPWDKGAAMPRIRKWASSDGSGDLDKINWGKFGQCFFWHAPNPEKIGDFKFPYADIINGSPHVVRRAVANALARLPNANIPDSDKRALRQAAQRQLERFKKKGDAVQGTDPLEKFDLESAPGLYAAHFMVHAMYAQATNAELKEQLLADHALIVAIMAERGVPHSPIAVSGWEALDRATDELAQISEDAEEEV